MLISTHLHFMNDSGLKHSDLPYITFHDLAYTYIHLRPQRKLLTCTSLPLVRTNSSLQHEWRESVTTYSSILVFRMTCICLLSYIKTIGNSHFGEADAFPICLDWLIVVSLELGIQVLLTRLRCPFKCPVFEKRY